jgi:hypothetical protein
MHVSGRAAALVESANLTGHELLTRSQLFLYPVLSTWYRVSARLRLTGRREPLHREPFRRDNREDA